MLATTMGGRYGPQGIQTGPQAHYLITKFFQCEGRFVQVEGHLSQLGLFTSGDHLRDGVNVTICFL